MIDQVAKVNHTVGMFTKDHSLQRLTVAASRASAKTDQATSCGRCCVLILLQSAPEDMQPVLKARQALLQVQLAAATQRFLDTCGPVDQAKAIARKAKRFRQLVSLISVLVGTSSSFCMLFATKTRRRKCMTNFLD